MGVEPRIRYTRGADGSSIAYWAMGDGRPLVFMPTIPWTHLERELSIPGWRRRFEQLAAGRSLVRYDPRGFGLSEPAPSDVSLNAHVNDLAAVLDVLEVRDCDLLAMGDSGMVAIEFCALYPNRVGQLVLWNSYANRSPMNDSPQIRAMGALWEEDWHTYTEVAIGTYFHWKHGDRASVIAELYRAAATQEALQLVVGALRDVDVSERLGAVETPTLVVRTEGSFPDLRDLTRRLAAGLPRAEVKVVPGETGWWDFYDDEDLLVTTVNDFLGLKAPVGDDPRSQDSAAAPGVVRTVLFTDMVGHTEMMQCLGDAGGRQVLREHERVTRELLGTHGGLEVKTIGDGFMASFASVSNAMRCAIALQRGFADLAHEMPEPISIRVGLNAGEPIEEDGDLFGSTVILASRIAAEADAGQILVPDSVRGLLTGKTFVFSDRGGFVPKGFAETVRLSEVIWSDRPNGR